MAFSAIAYSFARANNQKLVVLSREKQRFFASQNAERFIRRNDDPQMFRGVEEEDNGD
jgi:hypothetical protein